MESSAVGCCARWETDMPRPNPTPEDLEADMWPHPLPTEDMSNAELLARAARLAKAVVSGGAPRKESPQKS